MLLAALFSPHFCLSLQDDSDCEGDLVCEQRDGGEAVSGCSGGEESTSDTDYCVHPSDMASPPTSSTVVPDPAIGEIETTTQIGEDTTTVALDTTTAEPVATTIESDTTAESETTTQIEEGTTTTVPPLVDTTTAEPVTTTIETETDNAESETEVPTASPATAGTEISSGAQTTLSTAVPTLSSAPALPVMTFRDDCSPTTPCEKCVGDCQTDNDCVRDLVCFQRERGDPSPPGCSGTDPSSKFNVVTVLMF